MGLATLTRLSSKFETLAIKMATNPSFFSSFPYVQFWFASTCVLEPCHINIEEWKIWQGFYWPILNPFSEELAARRRREGRRFKSDDTNEGSERT